MRMRRGAGPRRSMTESVPRGGGLVMTLRRISSSGTEGAVRSCRCG
jgi:hypothetical protein